jgi:hypothetical protein
MKPSRKNINDIEQKFKRTVAFISVLTLIGCDDVILPLPSGKCVVRDEPVTQEQGH